MNNMQQLERSREVKDTLKAVADALGCDWRQVPNAIETLEIRVAGLRAEKQRIEAILAMPGFGVTVYSGINQQEQEA